MRHFSSLAPLLLALITTVAAAQTSQVPTLEERMSQNDFRASGLSRLSPEELKFLNDWLTAHGTPGGPMVTPSGKPIFYMDESAREVIEAHIDGVFTGWRGKSVFTLDNGQEWRQAESGSYDAGKLSSPSVRIKPMVLGSWLMYVDGCGCSVRVQRVK